MTEREKITSILKTYGFDQDLAHDVSGEILKAIKSETLRDKFAMSALKAIIMNNNGSNDMDIVKNISSAAYRMADAMLAERNKEPENVE